MKEQLDAYRIFFPAGWLLAFWGVLLWILFPWNLVSYPGIHHPDIMMGGFFLCFVCGFLMTAVPKFTGTFGPTVLDQKLSFAVLAILFFSLLPAGKVPFYLAVVINFIFLIYFSARRVLVRKNNPPDSFIFVGFGLITGIVGVLILLANELTEVNSQVYMLGRLFFLQTYIMCLVLGVGSRLVPALLGWAPLPTEAKHSSKDKKIFFVLGGLFVVTYLCESIGETLHATILRALVISFITLKYWKLYKFPNRKAVQTWGLWLSAWSVVLGVWGIVFFPQLRIHLLHIIYISGLGLMTFMIAVRVTLSHGNHEMSLEKKSKILAVGGGLLFLAGFTRFSAGIRPDIYQSHLLYAAITWIAGLLLWGWLFLPKMFKISEKKA